MDQMVILVLKNLRNFLLSKMSFSTLVFNDIQCFGYAQCMCENAYSNVCTCIYAYVYIVIRW